MPTPRIAQLHESVGNAIMFNLSDLDQAVSVSWYNAFCQFLLSLTVRARYHEILLRVSVLDLGPKRF